MYNVSEAFKAAMARPIQHFRLRGRMRFGARTLSFTEAHIIKNSFNIVNQCSGSDNVEIGTVYTAELNATFCGLDFTRYSLKDAEIEPNLELLTDDGYEAVPLGIFVVTEANWATDGVEIVAYDRMSKFDKTALLSGANGTIYDYLILACRTCGVTLGMERAEVQALPNGSEMLSIYAENDIETWRDIVAWCAQTTATFATIDRSGCLILKMYGTEPVDTIDDRHRFTGAKFSDFETRYTGISIVNLSDQITKYYGLTVDDGLTYNLGSNPLLQYGLDDQLEIQRRAILDALAIIDYVPMEVSMIGSPAYDLGDVIRFAEGIADGTKISCVTKYDWTYGGDYTVTGVGENPALASARSKVDKNIAGLLSQTAQDSMHYYDYINVESYTIADGHKADIIDFRYVTTKQTHIDFHAEIKYTLTTTEIEDKEELVFTENDGVIKVSYNLNGEDIEDYYPVETASDGTHLLHLTYVWSSTANVIGTFTVSMELAGGSVTIEIADCRGYIAGQGLVGDGAWDGNTEIEEEIKPYDIAKTLIGIFKDDVAAGVEYIEEYGMHDQITSIDIRNVLLGQFAESISGLSKLCRFDAIHNANIMEYDGVKAESGVWVLEDRTTRGTITTPVCNTSSVIRITSLNSGDDVAYIVSFDRGETWWVYAGHWQEPDYTQGMYGMVESTMRSIPISAWNEKVDGTIMVRAILLGSAVLTDIQIYTEDIIK